MHRHLDRSNQLTWLWWCAASFSDRNTWKKHQVVLSAPAVLHWLSSWTHTMTRKPFFSWRGKKNKFLILPLWRRTWKLVSKWLKKSDDKEKGTIFPHHWILMVLGGLDSWLFNGVGINGNGLIWIDKFRNWYSWTSYYREGNTAWTAGLFQEIKTSPYPFRWLDRFYISVNVTQGTLHNA